MKKCIFLLYLILCISCTRKVENDKCLPLKKTIELNLQSEDKDILENIGIIPLETTDESLLGECRIIDVDFEKVIVKDMNTIYIFNVETGKYESRICKLGNGPEDYVSLSDVVVDSSHQQLYVLDGKGNVKVYGYDGGFRKEYGNDSIASMEMLDISHFVTFNRPNGQCKYDINIYDNEWRVLRNVRQRNGEKVNYKDIIEIKDFNIFNGLPCFMEADTLFQIKEESIHSLFYIAKGDLALPMEVFTDIKRKKERASYIWGDYGFLVGDIYFLSFYYDNKIYYDIWNISSMELMYRNIVSSPDDPRGVLVHFDGKEIYVWPSFVKNDNFYCVVMNEEAQKLSLSKMDEGNPLILVGRVARRK